MDHQQPQILPEVTYQHSTSDTEFKARVRKTTIILSIVTVIELGLGLLLYATDFSSAMDHAVKGVIIILSLAKAFYIVSIFINGICQQSRTSYTTICNFPLSFSCPSFFSNMIRQWLQYIGK